MEIPVHLLKGLFYLTPEELNKKLLKDKKEYNFHNIKWSDQCLQNGIFFDLSQVRWVNLGAASLLILWIERAKKDNIQVYLALPYKKLTTKEIEKTQKGEKEKLLNSNRDKRIKANLFLKTIQFDRVAKCEHVLNRKEVLISEDFEFKSNKIEEEQFLDAFEINYFIKDTSTDFSLFDYKHIVPLTWIDSHNVEQGISNLEIHFEKVLANKDRGIEIFDVLALKNVLLSELLKNVKEHAGEDTNHGLLAVGLMSTKSLGTYQKNLSTDSKGNSGYTDHIEQGYINWLFKSKFENFIEIYFGDSGVGILDSGLKEVYNNLYEKEEKSKFRILDWAFDKWSTRKEKEPIRGTKGLYRIKRIIDKYEGIILIKTDNLIGGYQKGGHSPSVAISNNEYTDKNIESPGTFIQIKLCPYKDIIKFNFDFEIHKINNPWSVVFYKLPNGEPFGEWIKKEESFKKNNTLLVLNFEKNDIQVIQNVLLDLKELSFIRHSNAIVVYLINNIGNEALANIADSINKTIEKEHGGKIQREDSNHDFENVCSPVLLVGKGNSIFCFGEDKNILSTLDEIYMSGSTNLESIEYYKSLPKNEQDQVKSHFRTDPIMRIASNGNLIYDLNDIQFIFKNKIADNLKLRTPYLSPICSPKLNVVKEWYEINTILKGKESQSKEIDLSQFFAFGLYLKFREKYPDYIISPKTTHVLIDHNQQDEIAKEFAKLIGIDNTNIINIQEDVDYNIPRRTQLFDPNDDVIIITSIISSSETIRRLVKFAKRDLAKPMIILCLIDKRDDIKSIETWSTLTQILSIYPVNTHNTLYSHDDVFNIDRYIELQTQIKQCQTYVSPSYEKETSIKNYKINEELKNHFINKKAVHYNHIGNVNNRHFTFYLDKQKILDTHSFIWDEFILAISNWVAENEIEKFTLIIPQYIKENANVWTGYVNYIQEKIGDSISVIKEWNVDKPNLIRENDDFVFLDFGALTGNTINKFVENLEFPKRVLIVILFSQFQDNGSEFYTKVRALEYLRTVKTEYKQRSLFDDYKEEVKKIKHEAKIKIEFLHNLPIDIYNSSTCPICEHDRMLEYYKMNTQYMIDFCEDRKKRLKIKSRKKTNEHPPCDFYHIEGDDKYTELSSELIMKMFELKLLLNCAKSNTHNREEVLKILVTIATDIEQISNPHSDLYAFLFLVSHEVLWLQREPLVFREIRKIVTNIALNIAIKDLSVLMNGFENSIDDEKQREKIAIRYKYAAITVLRSADKSVFCENVSRVVESSIKKNGVLSNNLIQNTFYHIHSLQVNNYNKSKKYFEDLKTQFEIIEQKSSFSSNHKQISAFWDLKTRNNTILKTLEIERVSIVATFRHFQNEFLNLYKTEGHPVFYESFTALDFRTLDPKAYPSYLKDKENSSYYKALLSTVSELTNNWLMVRDTIMPIVNGLPFKIFQSEYFKNNPFFLEHFVYGSPSSIISLFSQWILTFTEETLEDKNKYIRYHNLYDLIYDNLIKYKLKRGINGEDSSLKRFLSDFDTNLKESIDSIFIKSDFHDLTSNIDESINVFYPKTILAHFLKQIKDNIKLKKNNQDGKLDDVSIKFESEFKYDNELKYVQLTIYNTETHEYPLHSNPKGALYQFKEDLDCFGGSLDYDIENNFFVLTIKFLCYE